MELNWDKVNGLIPAIIQDVPRKRERSRKKNFASAEWIVVVDPYPR